jgi:hypothetical protein
MKMCRDRQEAEFGNMKKQQHSTLIMKFRPQPLSTQRLKNVCESFYRFTIPVGCCVSKNGPQCCKIWSTFPQLVPQNFPKDNIDTPLEIIL